MEVFSREGVQAIGESLGRPIPGQSLTNSPDNKYQWEGPPDFTDLKEALGDTVNRLLDRQNLVPILKSINDGVPIMDIVAQIGYVGFREGKWNPDLMLLLAEPLAYALMSMAENADIKYRIDSDDSPAGAEDDSKAESRYASLRSQNVKKIKGKLKEIGGKAKAMVGGMSNEISAKINEEVTPSLLDRSVETQEDIVEEDTENLLDRRMG
jgi:hypothetical protein|tara:strand:+ start:115 stop:744 length:630 start_codon:yes stop_codon:yes gene_type:complete